jgi:hypothetical protein
MKTCTCFLALLISFVASSWAETHVSFARSGRRVTVPLVQGDALAAGPLGLAAYGRRWDTPVERKNDAVEFTAPSVRVPVVFQIVAGAEARICSKELVVLPERPVSWDKDTQVVAVETPRWFDTWYEAAGLPVQKFAHLDALKASGWRASGKSALLILGREAAGYGSLVAERMAADHSVNVLVLESDWFRNNEMIGHTIALLPKHMGGPLADLQSQNWPLPPSFWRHRLRISNRQTWIAGPQYPLVEEIRSSQRGSEALRMVFSYLSWQQQLGRSEVADDLFLRLLTETAKGAKDRRPLDGRWHPLYPAAKNIKAAERPVLAAALKSATSGIGSETESQEIRGYVLDLRGEKSPPSDFFAETDARRRIEARIHTRSPLLILGDKPVLDRWKWLELDRPAGRSSRPDVFWWPDNSLPPSLESQLRLMGLFTEWNVFLEDTPQEAVCENRKNGL